MLDTKGNPLAGVAIEKRASGERELVATSDGRGEFQVELPAGEDEVVLEAASPATLARNEGGVLGSRPRFATVRACHARRHDAQADHILIAAPAVAVAGAVVDESGIGVAGAKVAASVEDADLTSFPFARDRMERVRNATTTDASGSFALATVAFAEGAVVRATLDGYEDASEPVPSVDRDDLFLTLRPTNAAAAHTVNGVVRLPDGSPAAGASIRYREHEVSATNDGSFEFELRTGERDYDAEQATSLGAGLEGYGPAIIDDFDRVLFDARPHSPPPIELILGERARVIAGRVVDDEGDGLPDWNVMIRNGVVLNRNMVPIPTAEALAGNVSTQTDIDGRFELIGLLDRSYEVWAYHDSTLQAIEIDGPVHAGTADLVLVASSDGLHAVVEGIVLSRRGQPIESAQVGVERVTARMNNGSMWASGEATTTDAGGRFRLTNVPREGIRLSVFGSQVVPEHVPFGPDDDPENVRLSVARRCHFQARLLGADSSDPNFSMIDESGQRLALYAFQSNGWSSNSMRDFGSTGTTPVLAVSEDARVIVLYVKGEEVARRSVLLEADGVNMIEIELP